MPFGSVPSALVIAPSKGIKNLKDFVAEAKAKPGGFTYASAGVGSTTHLTAERFRLSAGFHGGACAVPRRRLPARDHRRPRRFWLFADRDLAAEHQGRAAPGDCRVSARERAAALPDVPTTLEAGYANSDYVIWVGLFLPAKTPRADCREAEPGDAEGVAIPGLRERLTGLDVTPMPMTPAEFDALIKKEIAATPCWRKRPGCNQSRIGEHKNATEDDMKRLTLLLLSTLALAVGGPALAQDKYPSKPVKIIVPYAPGGGTDITSRIFGDQMKNSLGQQFVVENKPGAFGILAIEEMARSKPDGYTLMIGNVSTNAITPILFKKKFNIDFEKDVVSVARPDIYPSFLIATTTNFDVKSSPNWSRSEEKSRQGPLHQRRRRQLPALRHGDFRAARRRRHDPHPEQDRRRRHDQRSRRRRCAGRGPQCRELRGDDQGRQAAADRGGRRAAPGGLSRRADPGRGRLPGVGTLHWQSMLAPAATPKPVLDTLFKAIVEASKQPALKEAFDKQLVSIKVSDSLDEAKTWLKGELDAWRKITS